MRLKLRRQIGLKPWTDTWLALRGLERLLQT